MRKKERKKERKEKTKEGKINWSKKINSKKNKK